MSESKQYYCRACGTNKGHSSNQCKNAAGLRACLQSQDTEVDGYLQRLKVADKEHEELTKLRSANVLLGRIVNSLLELCEAKRAGMVK